MTKSIQRSYLDCERVLPQEKTFTTLPYHKSSSIAIAAMVSISCLGLTLPAIAIERLHTARSHTARSPTVVAQTLAPTAPTNAAPQSAPDLKALAAGQVIPGVVTSKTPSPIYLSIPSLWWITQQLAAIEQYGDKFVQEWIAYPSAAGKPGRVDLLVNRQLWSLSDYIQRYGFVNQFSAVARSYGYNIRVYDNPDRQPTASYSCDFSPAEVQTLTTPMIKESELTTIANYAVRNQIADQSTCKLRLETTLRTRKLNPLVK